ncbi:MULTISPECIES: 4Fe-4S dicluster domain-containing protein [Prochlorococcus]|uniref:4Fe-4S dicluster domain-containing protein n=1 Tax=Prochlorococcus TaxID=1218 RepID=UPI0005339828|nr:MULTISPECIES: 4Fe-4S binding protein [Prochlorococcus]KGG12034.1 Light dependent period modulator LdpA [Prochlorococcus sp. MIT 0601]
MDRFSRYKEILSNSLFFKLVCGAGYEDLDKVSKLSYVYTLAGCKGFDLSANPLVVKACRQGIDAALSSKNPYFSDENDPPFITVSVGMPGDHHVRKAVITNDCIRCNSCIPACPTNAIPSSLEVYDHLCIGCGNCESACPPSVEAVHYRYDSKKIEQVLPLCIEAGAESIELHASIADDITTIKEWKTVCNCLPNGMLSMCLDRTHMTNNHLMERIKLAKDIADDRLIIQADGVAMGGNKDDFNTTLQAVSIADIINKELILKDKRFKDLPLLISGGTNSLTGQLARQCGVSFSGISIGTHARKIVKTELDLITLRETNMHLNEAVMNAYNLIENNLRPSRLIPSFNK